MESSHSRGRASCNNSGSSLSRKAAAAQQRIDAADRARQAKWVQQARDKARGTDACNQILPERMGSHWKQPLLAIAVQEKGSEGAALCGKEAPPTVTSSLRLETELSAELRLPEGERALQARINNPMSGHKSVGAERFRHSECREADLRATIANLESELAMTLDVLRLADAARHHAIIRNIEMATAHASEIERLREENYGKLSLMPGRLSGDSAGQPSVGVPGRAVVLEALAALEEIPWRYLREHPQELPSLIDDADALRSDCDMAE